MTAGNEAPHLKLDSVRYAFGLEPGDRACGWGFKPHTLPMVINFTLPGPWDYPDRGFGRYRPFPEWDRREAQAREMVGRVRDAWAVLRGRASIWGGDE